MGYVNICCDIRNKYVKQYNEEKRDFELCSKDYLEEIKTVDYLYFMSETDLKQLKKEYLHWSSKTNLIGLSPIDHKPITPGPLTEKERKRNIQDG